MVLFREMDPTFFVDGARPEDMPAVMELERLGFIPPIREAEAVFAARRSLFPEGFLVLRETGTRRVVAYLCCERWPKLPPLVAPSYALGHDPAPRHAPEGGVLYIASMTLHPELRGTGLGARLFREGRARILVEAPGIDRELLLVNRTWSAARKLYERSGFVEQGMIPAFFPRESGPSDEGIVMLRRLKAVS